MRTYKFLLLFSLISLYGCAAGISRQGYKLEDIKNKDLSSCEFVIKKNYSYDVNEVDIVGKINSYDTGISVTCNHDYVLRIFCEEACALDADILNIVDERMPDILSSCYRAKAEFIRLKDRQKVKELKNSEQYYPELIVEMRNRGK